MLQGAGQDDVLGFELRSEELSSGGTRAEGAHEHDAIYIRLQDLPDEIAGPRSVQPPEPHSVHRFEAACEMNNAVAAVCETGERASVREIGDSPFDSGSGAARPGRLSSDQCPDPVPTGHQSRKEVTTDEPVGSRHQHPQRALDF